LLELSLPFFFVCLMDSGLRDIYEIEVFSLRRFRIIFFMTIETFTNCDIDFFDLDDYIS